VLAAALRDDFDFALAGPGFGLGFGPDFARPVLARRAGFFIRR
jgi:hypothetical protein